MASPSDGVVSQLVEMGFSPEKAEQAYKATGSEDVQKSMDCCGKILRSELDAQREFALLQHPELKKPVYKASLGSINGCGYGSGSNGATYNDTDPVIPPLMMIVTAHAARTSHQNFAESTEEIKPLTPEEKATQVAKLEEKMKQKRIAREEQEKKDLKEREKLRRKGGKELTEIKQKMELDEMKKLAEERRRQKVEDRLARQKVKEQIARDREQREAGGKDAGGKASVPIPQPAVDVKKNYTACRLQVRLVDGSAKTLTFEATDTLQDVLGQLESPQTRLMTTFPKRIFTNADVGKTLKDLGLVPSAVLIQTHNTE